MNCTMSGALAVLALLLFSFQPSIAQEAATHPTVMAYLESSQSTSFMKVLKGLGLDKVIEEAPYTIFVPTDAAFASLMKAMNISSVDDTYFMDTFPVMDIVRYHVSPQALMMKDLPHGQKVQTFLKSPSATDKLRLTVDRMVSAPKVVIRGWESFATTVTADVAAGKSIVHVVDKVLLPKLSRDMGFYPTTLLDMMVFHRTSYFQAAVGTIGTAFWDKLKLLQTPVTVMMPTDAAFKKAIAALGSLEELQGSGKLAKLINYHIADGYGPTSRMIAKGSIKTWNPQSSWVFTYTPTGGVIVEGEKSKANVVIKDSFTAMGAVVHVIDNVLLPKDL